MPLDINTISAVREELRGRIIGTKIEKINQPQRDMLVITLRGKPGDAQRLLISAGTGSARVHLTEHTFENPASPPMFCMLLRKHLTGARVEDVSQPPSERILEFKLKTSSAMGDMGIKHLIVELFGRIPNIILTDHDGIIIDCLRRIGGDGGMSDTGRRMILPGLKYRMPEPVAEKSEMPRSTEHSIAAGTGISKVLDAAYTRKAVTNAMQSRSAALLKTMKSTQKRIIRRLAAQKSELQETKGRDYLRECGDIIMANMHVIGKGDEILLADDFYAGDGAVREIKLDPLLSAQKNAAKYYKAYTKAKNASEHLVRQISNGEAELNYVESVIEQIERAENEQELDEIRAELINTRYLKAGTAKKKAVKRESKPLELKSSTGTKIFVGKNNTQNDILTLKSASKTDLWFHAQKIHGAHVIVKTDGKAVDDTTLREAAEAAVYYSAAREAGKVPVDYTFVRYVKKPPGARPGMVTYSEFKTIVVKPKIELGIRN